MTRLLAMMFLAAAVSAQMINPGTPPGITNAFDCKVRSFAYDYGKKLLPQRGDFRTLFEALQLQACNMTTPAKMDEWQSPTIPTPASAIVYVDATKGSDSNTGTMASPFQTIAKAVASVAGKAGSTVLLRAGTYYTGTVQITTANNGLTIQNYNGEKAVVSGGTPIKVAKGDWKPYKVSKGEWQIFEGQNEVFGKAQSKSDTDTIKYIGTFDTLDACEAGINSSAKGPFKAFTYHHTDFDSGKYAGQCFGVTDSSWGPTAEAKVTSGKFDSQNTWVADIKGQVNEITGLRINGQRAIRAKYPNGNMELSGNWLRGAGQGMGGGEYIKGWNTAKSEWVPPFKHQDSQDLVVNDADWPSVEWPHYEGSQTGEGAQGDFHIGLGGYCESDLQDPLVGPSGYWCAMNPPRGQCWDPKTNKGRGCTQTHMSPDGLVWARAANYSDPTTAVVQVHYTLHTLSSHRPQQ
jgi:hypothetical protein